jgi:uncharacterized protein Yka (UPF0111/DUF47 family)
MIDCATDYNVPNVFETIQSLVDLITSIAEKTDSGVESLRRELGSGCQLRVGLLGEIAKLEARVKRLERKIDFWMH